MATFGHFRIESARRLGELCALPPFNFERFRLESRPAVAMCLYLRSPKTTPLRDAHAQFESASLPCPPCPPPLETALARPSCCAIPLPAFKCSFFRASKHERTEMVFLNVPYSPSTMRLGLLCWQATHTACVDAALVASGSWQWCHITLAAAKLARQFGRVV